MAIAVSDWTTNATVGAPTDLNHLVESESISLAVSLLKGASSSRWVLLLSEVLELDRDDLVLLIDHLQEVFLHLENVASVLVAVIIHEITSSEPVILTSDSDKTGGHWLVIV